MAAPRAALVLLGVLALLAPAAVNAEATDATKSESSGNGLQFATAGVLAQFTVTAKDESGVRRTSGGDEWIVELDGTRSITGSVVDNLDGTYQVSYTATKSGSYEAGVKLAKSGGLTGSYFENVWFFYTPVKVTVDPQINMDWGVGRITPTGANYISVRWVGKVKTQYAETYTFYATTDDGARLWVDNVPLIDRWDSYCNETSATIALKANVFYNMKMEYKQVTGSAFAKLSWASQSTPKEIVPSSQLYYETQAKKSPFSFIVMPNVANGTRSTAAGAGLAVATAGTAAQFTVQANDMYDNERGEGGDVFSVRVYPPGSIEQGSDGRAVHGVVVDNTDSSYSVEYTTYKSGVNTLYAALLVRGGVTATYYDNSNFEVPVKYAEGTTNLQKVQFASSTVSDNDNSVPTVEGFSVRFAGFVAPTKDSTYQFQWTRGIAAAQDRVRLWVDNSLIIDQWSSLASSQPSGNIELRSAYYYDTKLDYKYVSGCTSGTCAANAKLQWMPSGGSLSDITSANLYRGYNVMDSPFGVDVNPAGTCAAKSIAIPNQAAAGHSLELSTAGLQSEFTITAKDLYGNLRLTGGDNFKVRLTGVDSTSGLVQDMSSTNPGTYRVVYTATKSGTYDVSIVFGASGINQSPFRMVSQPARRHLGKSIPTGQALTLATAGVQASVTITVKDRHDNWQPDPSVVDADVKFGMTDVATHQPTNVVQDSLTPPDVPSFVDKVSYIGASTNAGYQVSTPTDLDNPKLVLRYRVTRSGKYSMALGGSKSNDGPVAGSPFDLTLFPNLACATTSTASGDSLSLATAGIPGTFTIMARDEYFNLRGSNVGDNFVARVRQYYSKGGNNDDAAGMDVVECGRPGADCQSYNTYSWGWTTTGGRDKPAAVVDNGDGSYAISYQATRSTTNYLWAAFAQAGGLQATYYVGSTTNTGGGLVAGGEFGATGANRVVQVDKTVDFSVTASTTRAGITDAVSWSARWTGLVQPSLSETYTFFAGGDVSTTAKAERVKLWVDNSLIIHQWSSLGSTGDSAAVAPSGKIHLEKDTYYEVLLAAKTTTADTSTTAKFQLKWQASHHSASVISSSRLFVSHHVSNSPFALNVLPAITCAATSRVYRPALTLTTAGVMASFTVQSKDAFDNIRVLSVEDSTAFSFSIVANASLPADDSDANRVQPSEDDAGAVAFAASTFYIGNGGYQVNYTATKQGVFNVRGQIMQPGGVFGSYYENDDLTDHGSDTLGIATETKPFTRMDATIDFDWNGGRPVPAPSPTMKKDIGPSYFSARWRGMVRPLYSEVYTFSIAVDDGAKLWINDLLVIDHWYSRCSEVDGTIALMAGTLYPMRLEYKQVVGNASAHLSWSSRSQGKIIVPSTSLYSNSTTYNLCNRNESLYVEPAVVCSATSTAEGAGLTGATAGMPAKFTIQSRDEYMNNRKLSDAGIRPGSAEYFCDDWAHSGTLLSGGAHTLNTVLLDATSASAQDDYYTGRTITLTSGTGAGQARIVTDYFGASKTATVYPPLSVLPDSTSKYSIGNYGGQWSEKCDDTRTKAFREGHPEFHVRVTPIIEGSQAPYHAAGIVDAALIDTDNLAGSGITRLASTEYPGGLTATYYDTPGTDTGASVTYNPGFSKPVFSTKCTTAQACDETIDFSHAGTEVGTELKLTYGEYPEAIGSLGFTSGALAATYYDHPSKGWSEDQRLANSDYAVRWSGFISPTLAGVYTFHAHFFDDKTGSNDAVGAGAHLNDRVKLWIDNKLVIQQWNSLGTNAVSAGVGLGTFYFKAAYPAAYPITIHYKNPKEVADDAHSVADEGGMTLRWENLATGTTLTATVHIGDDDADATDATVAFCGSDTTGFGGADDANAKLAQPIHVCLATMNIPVAGQNSGAYATTFGSTHGAASEVSDDYIAQVIKIKTPGIGEESKYIRDYEGVVSGTVRLASTTTTVINLATESSTTDNFYAGHYIVITAGTGAGQARLITAYDGCDQSGCDPMQGAGTVAALWSSTDTTVSASSLYCDCSGATAQQATVAAWQTNPDTTSKYSIFMYRVEMAQPLTFVTDDATTIKKKTAQSTFSISTGYNLVTYGQADCAEFTGVAQGGGNTTRLEADIAASALDFVVFDAAALFGGLVPDTVSNPPKLLWLKVGTNEHVQVTAVSANSITTNTAGTAGDTVAAAVTCSAAAPCTTTPRNTMILAADANTLENFYAGYYVQILSGTCAGQWRKVEMSKYNGFYVTISVQTPWAVVGTSGYLGCTQPDSSSVYYLSKVCTENTVTLQTVGPLSALTIRPGFDGEAILQSAQSSLGASTSGAWGPGFYGTLNTQGDAYPYPYQPYDHGCCKALSGNDNDDVYNNMLIVITGGTGRGQRRFTVDYAGTTLTLTVYPDWAVLPDSTSRYAIFRAKATPPMTTAAAIDASAAANPTAYNTAPVVPSSRLFPLRGRYEVTYTPTVKGDYQVHASLAQGSGLDATYYDDMELSEPVSSWVEQTVDFDVSDAQRGFGNDVPRGFGDLALSDKQSFSVRWAGLLQLFDHVEDAAASVFTFEAGIAETDERVKLWVDNSLIIDRWETYDYLSATTFSATIGLRSPYYYDVKMEYKQYAGAAAAAVLRWECGVAGSPCQSKQVIPSSNLFQAKEVSGSPFPPHEVQAAPTCAARSTVRGIPLSLATAGVMDSFTIQSHDEYDNERGAGGDHWVVRAVPYNEWDRREPYETARSSKDCVGCPRSVHGTVEDMGDSSYVASFNGTKKGAYKVLTSLAAQGGMFATYYAANWVTSRFHRAGQVGDSETDFPVPCVYRADYRTTDVTPGYTAFSDTVGAWRGALTEAAAGAAVDGIWRDTFQCQNWISGTAQAGFCAENHHFDGSGTNVDGTAPLFRGCSEVTVTDSNAEEGLTGSTATSVKLDITGSVIVATKATGAQTVGMAAEAGQYGFENALAGLMLFVVDTGESGIITANTADVNGNGDLSDDGDAVATVSGLTTTTVAPKYRLYDCGVNPTTTTEASCAAASEVLAPQAWVPTPTKTIILDVASSEINDAYVDFDIKIVKGACLGQVRKIVGYAGRSRLASVALPWTTTDGTITDAYGRTSDIFGCTTPDATSEYILYKAAYAPGSLDDTSALFAVRWAGFVKPSATSEYTFRALVSGTTGTPNAERVKLWIDNSLIIDQWTSIASTSPSGTISFPSAADNLYDVQMEYKRVTATTDVLTGALVDANVPAGNLAPMVSLQWKNEQSGSDATLSEAYDYKIIGTGRLFSDYPVPNSRVLDLLVADTCATVSVVSGDGLTTATAGGEASFTITAKDSFANDRELEEDSFVVAVTGPGGFALNAFPAPSPSVPGNYHVSYTATESGSYEIAVQRANAGGLRGEYYNNMWLLGDAAVTSVDAEVDFSWGTGAVAPPEAASSVVTGSDYMSVRWSGLFKPELSELYTFYSSVDNGARLYVDGKLVVDQWEVSAAAEYNATLDATAGLLYELKVEYRHTTGDAGASLAYASPSVAKRVIPSSRLFHAPQHVFGSPFTSYVSPAPTCGTTSFSAGGGLCFATAGHYAAFTIQARDEYQNTRTKWEDTFVVKASQTDHLGRAKTGTVGANVVKGRYNVAYLVTKAGSMGVYASLAVAGGITATYYDAVSATYYSAASGGSNTYAEYSLPAKSRVDSNIHMNNYMASTGGGTCKCNDLTDLTGVTGVTGTPTGTGAACGCLATCLVQDQVFAARWSGFIRPSTAAEYTFKTFAVVNADQQDRVKLWLDNQLVIDQWTSLAAALPTATFSFPVAMDYYELEMEYRSMKATLGLAAYKDDASDSPTVRLVACNAALHGVADCTGDNSALITVGSSYLAQSADVRSSPFMVTVKSDVTDFAVSTMAGDALSIGTAGVESNFVLQAKDTWGNTITEGGDQYLVHIASVGGSVLEGSVKDNTDGTYSVKYTPSTQGTYDVNVYLGSSTKTTTLLVEPGSICAATSVTNGLSLTVATAGYAATFTIQAKDAFKNLRTLGDNDFVMRVTGPGGESHNNPMGYIGVSPNTNLGRYTVAYKATQSGAFSVDVKMASGNGLHGVYYRDDTFSNAVKTATDGTVDFNWGSDSPDSKVGIVDGFSIEWKGYVKPGYSQTTTFMTKVGEKDERVKLWVDDQWVVDQWSSISSTSPTGTLWLVANTLYDVKLQYKDESGSAELHLLWESTGQTSQVVPSSRLFSTAEAVAGSPFTATVFPALASGTISTATGSGLSLATAGTPASFTIQAKDHLGNIKTTSDDLFVVRARHNADYTRRNVMGTVTSLGGNLGLYSVSYTPTWKRNHLSCAGAGSTNTCDGKYEFDSLGGTRAGSGATSVYGVTANQVGLKHKFHDLLVSQAVKGGLFATYYTNVQKEASRTKEAPAIYIGDPYRTKVVPTVDHTMSSALAGCVDAVDGQFGVRYVGFFSPPTAATYVFTTPIAETASATEGFERIRLWVDNSLIIDQWASLASTTPSGQLQFDTANALYDIKVEYKQDKDSVTDAAAVKLQYQYPDVTSAVTIPSTRLYQSHDLSFKIFDKTGLTATYYNTPPTTTGELGTVPVKSVQESTVDWSGTTVTDRPYPQSVTNGEFSVRWTGFVKPSRTDQYTFFATLHGSSGTGTTLERVQLWVDNSLVIAQWASLATLDPSGTLSFPVAEDYYNLVMDYKVNAADANRGIQLQWQNDGLEYARYGVTTEAGSAVYKGVVRADRLFQIRTSTTVERDDFAQWDVDYHKDGVSTLEDRSVATTGQWAKINGCPAQFQDCSTTFDCDNRRYELCRGQGTRTNEILRVDVKPAVICAAKSTVADNDGSLSISTAGVTRTFTLTARDAYDNQRDATDDSFIARATMLDGAASDPPFHGSFTHQTWETLYQQGELNNAVFDQNGKYEVDYFITRSSSYQMTIQSADVQGNGLYGTYFSTTSLSGTAVTQTDAAVDFNWGRSDPTTSTSIKAGAFSVRWAGYVKSNFTEIYTFYTNCDYGVRLYVDKRTVVDKWATAGKEHAGTVSLRQGVLYDLTFEYQTVGEVSYCSLSFSSPSTAKQIIPKSSLFVEAQTVQSGSLNQYTRPTVVSATVSTIHGPGLSIATAGIPASFTVLAKDMYGNLRDACADVMYARMVPDAPTCELGNYPYNWKDTEGGSFWTCSSVGKIALATTDTSVMTDQNTNNNNHGDIGTYNAFGMTKAIPKDTGSSWTDVSTACTREKFTGNKHPFTYVQTRATSHTLYVSEAPGGVGKTYKNAVGLGLMATYYETSEFGTPRNAMDCILQDGTAYSTAACNTAAASLTEVNQGAPASLTDDGIFSVRFTGLIRMPAATAAANAFTFHADVDDTKDERVKLWVDNSLIIDQWTSLNTVTPSSVIPANRHNLVADQLYDIKVEYKSVAGGATDGSKLDLQYEATGVTKATIPSTALFPSHPISAQSQRVRVNPNVAFSQECEVYGQGLTLATAGLQATFAIQSKDAYNNKRGTGGDLFIVRAFSDGCQNPINNVEGKQTCQPYGGAIATCGGAAGACPGSTNPAPEMNDGGDDDGLAHAGVVSHKIGGDYRKITTPTTALYAALCPSCPRIVRGDVVDNGDSTYTASFTGTQKGRYTVVTSLVNSGGLEATYYDTDSGSGAAGGHIAGAAANYDVGEGAGITTRVDMTVDWSAKAADASCDATGDCPSLSLDDSNFAVRWVGFVRPSRASQYTFHSYLGSDATPIDRVKLWVDNSIIIQQWTSLAASRPSGTMGFAKGNGYYDISMLYKCPDKTVSTCGYSLYWENTASGVASDDTSKGRIPSTRLFQRYDVPNTGLTCSGTPCINKDTASVSMHTTMQVMPSVTCASQSKANGDQLSLRTAGVAASFTIQAKDAYENTREDTSASFTVDLFGSGGSPIYNGGVSGATASSGNYIASYTAENAKVYDLFVKYGSENIKGSPFTTTIKPSNTCGTKSTIQGTGLTAASISPSKSAFTIQARDQYGNAKTQALTAGQDYVVRVVRTSGAAMQGTRGTPPFYGASAISTSPTVHGTFNTATNDGKYAGYYQVPSTPSPTGYTHYLYASWLAAGGVSATYYGTATPDNSEAGYTAPIDVLDAGVIATNKLLITRLGTHVADPAAALTTDDAHGNDKLTASAASFVIRMSGMYKTSSTQRYFQWTSDIDVVADRVRLWVDNKLIIDQWASISVAAPTGGYLFDSASGIYDIHAEFYRDSSTTTAKGLSVKDSTAAAGAWADIATDKLYFTETLSGSPYAVTVST